MPAQKKPKTSVRKTAKRKVLIKRPAKPSPAQIKKSFHSECLPFVRSARTFATRLEKLEMSLSRVQINEINLRIRNLERVLKGFHRKLLAFEKKKIFDAQTIFFFRHGLHSEVVMVWSPLYTLKFYNKGIDLERLDRAHDMISGRKTGNRNRPAVAF